MITEKSKTINWGRVIFVVVLIVVLFFSSNVFYKPVQKSARTSTRSRMLALHTALLQYREDEGVFPSGTDKEIISTLITRRKEYRKGKQYVYMEITMPHKNIFGQYRTYPSLDGKGRYLDAWGTPITIMIKGDAVILHSFGKNRKDDNGKKDDIVYINGKFIENNSSEKHNRL
ncbi:MAG: hypothetical protein A2017_09935 [Lentisphaerae bacterium GWF2_44_16]|nr:MAG: hypothetical protein A2017_09935 [Lentisphaerae bacterium GWF2_44_16]